jgi:hypothetical protein
MRNKEITIRRFLQNEKSTHGFLSFDGLFCMTLERPWLNNQKDNPNTKVNDSSRIPAGTYPLKVIEENISKKFPYKHLEVLNVPNRSAILIHRGNTVNDTLGCILVGADFVEGTDTLTATSKDTLNKIMELFEDAKEGTLIIQDILG